jgi:hypothetical protein
MPTVTSTPAKVKAVAGAEGLLFDNRITIASPAQTLANAVEVGAGVTHFLAGVTHFLAGVTHSLAGVTYSRAGVTKVPAGVTKTRRTSGSRRALVTPGFAAGYLPETNGVFYRACRRNRRHRNHRVKFTSIRADTEERMVRPSPPMSNVERQRRFRARNPGYNRKYTHRATAAQRLKMKQAYAEEIRNAMAAEAAAQQALNSTSAKPILMLPAPVETPIIPGMNTIQSASATVAAPLPSAA